MSRATLVERLNQIELLVLDVDGVLTDGRVVYSDDGGETKRFHIRDGAGIRYWVQSGRQAAIISGRSSVAVTRRAEELGIQHVYQGASNKLPFLRRLLDTTAVSAERVCAIGDDLPDLPVLRHVGVSVAVADACPELRAAADHVTELAGGQGAVREVIEWLMKTQSTWQSVLDRLNAEKL